MLCNNRPNIDITFRNLWFLKAINIRPYSGPGLSMKKDEFTINLNLIILTSAENNRRLTWMWAGFLVALHWSFSASWHGLKQLSHRIFWLRGAPKRFAKGFLTANALREFTWSTESNYLVYLSYRIKYGVGLPLFFTFSCCIKK